MSPVGSAERVARATSCKQAQTVCVARPPRPSLHSLYSGDASALVDIFRFLCTNFSQPIAAALRAHGYYPPPRWPKDPAMRDQMIVAHMYSGMRAICPSWTPSLSAPEFIRARDLVAVRVTLVLDVIKRLVAIHNRVVSANKANMRAAQARAKQGPPPIAAVDPIAEEDDLQVRNETDESGSNTSRASSGLAPPAESELNARKPASRWIATEFFNDDELALYRDQLQCARRHCVTPALHTRARACGRPSRVRTRDE